MTKSDIIKQILVGVGTAVLYACTFHATTITKLAKHEAILMATQQELAEIKAEQKENRQSNKHFISAISSLQTAVENLNDNLENIREDTKKNR